MTGKRRAAATAGLIALLIGCAEAAPAPVPVPAEEESFEIALWANDDSALRLPNLVAASAHPCGAIAVVRLRTMPPHRQPEGALAPEMVVEIDPEGRTLRRWGAPVDYEPLALEGDALLLRHGDQLLWIGTDGGIRRGDPARSLDEIESLACPAQAPHADSDYRQCGALRDGASGARRLIAYESACT